MTTNKARWAARLESIFSAADRVRVQKAADQADRVHASLSYSERFNSESWYAAALSAYAAKVV